MRWWSLQTAPFVTTDRTERKWWRTENGTNQRPPATDHRPHFSCVFCLFYVNCPVNAYGGNKYLLVSLVSCHDLRCWINLNINYTVSYYCNKVKTILQPFHPFNTSPTYYRARRSQSCSLWWVSVSTWLHPSHPSPRWPPNTLHFHPRLPAASRRPASVILHGGVSLCLPEKWRAIGAAVLPVEIMDAGAGGGGADEFNPAFQRPLWSMCYAHRW